MTTSDPQRRLVGTKLDEPCAGTVISVEIGPANAGGWPTRVHVAQSDFQPPLAGLPDFLNAHWRRIAADFRLHLEQGVVLPQTVWGASLGAVTTESPTGLTVKAIEAGGFAERCGMRAGDLLLALAGVRVLDTAQLWTVLAMLTPGRRTTATWVRDGGVVEGEAELDRH